MNRIKFMRVMQVVKFFFFFFLFKFTLVKAKSKHTSLNKY